MPKEIRFQNTLTRRVETLTPLDGDHVRLYTCGPTVYNFVHIGNLRTFLFEDVLRRTLKAFGYRVTQVMNLTDIDDKTIRGANAEGISLREFTDRYIAAFFADIDTLRVERAEHYPRATDYVPQMVGAGAAADRSRAHLHARGIDVLPHRHLPALRQALGDRPRAGDGRRPRRRRRVREGGRARLRPLEGGQGRGAVLGHRARPRPARLAPRVLGDVDGAARRDVRHPHRAASTTSSRTTRTRSRRARARPASRSYASGCTPSTCSSRARRWRSRSATSSPSATSWSAATTRSRSATCSSRCRTGRSSTSPSTACTPRRPASNASATRCAASPTRRRRAATARSRSPTSRRSSASSTTGWPTTSTRRARWRRSTSSSPGSTRRSTATASPPRRAARLDAALARTDAILGIVPKQAQAVADAEVDALIAERVAARRARDFARADAIRKELANRGIALEDTPHGTVWRRGV